MARRRQPYFGFFRFEQFETAKGTLAVHLRRVFALAVFLPGRHGLQSVRSLTLRGLAARLLVVVIALFGAYMWKKTSEVSELRGLMHGLEQRDEAPPSDKQLDHLFEIIARSQQGYRDLIDSFDDVLLVSTSTARSAVNRSFSDLVATHSSRYRQAVDRIRGRRAARCEELVNARCRASWSAAMGGCRPGTPEESIFGVLLRLCRACHDAGGESRHHRSRARRHALRKNEARFTELFESLQEGIYITTPDGAIVDAILRWCACWATVPRKNC